jgi:hypothetical protein
MSFLKLFQPVRLARPKKRFSSPRWIPVVALLGAGLVGCTSGSIAISSPGASSPTEPAAASSALATSQASRPSANPTRTAQAVALFTCASRTLAWDGKSPIDLTGAWAGDDDGVYIMRQIGDQVWWLGMSGIDQPLVDRGSDWTNVYLGSLKGDTVTGTYADVPLGQILDKGPVVVKLTPTLDGGISLERTDPLLETGFGGTSFTPCTLGS